MHKLGTFSNQHSKRNCGIMIIRTPKSNMIVSRQKLTKLVIDQCWSMLPPFSPTSFPTLAWPPEMAASRVCSLRHFRAHRKLCRAGLCVLFALQLFLGIAFYSFTEGVLMLVDLFRVVRAAGALGSSNIRGVHSNSDSDRKCVRQIPAVKMVMSHGGGSNWKITTALGLLF